MTSIAAASGCLSGRGTATGADWQSQAGRRDGSSGRARGHLIANVRRDLVELRGELVVVELERVQILLQPIVFLAISAASVISSSLAPNSRAASVWK